VDVWGKIGNRRRRFSSRKGGMITYILPPPLPFCIQHPDIDRTPSGYLFHCGAIQLCLVWHSSPKFPNARIARALLEITGSVPFACIITSYDVEIAREGGRS
jgi:hypothetical protein